MSTPIVIYLCVWFPIISQVSNDTLAFPNAWIMHVSKEQGDFCVWKKKLEYAYRPNAFNWAYYLFIHFFESSPQMYYYESREEEIDSIGAAEL